MKLTSLFKRKKPKWWGREKIICICHDIEAGLGHIGIDPEFSERASRAYLERLERMLASSATSLGIKHPVVQNGIVKIPICFDDFKLYERKIKYLEWESLALKRIKRNHFIAFGLHNCYAEFWLPNYREFLQIVIGLSTFKTHDVISSDELFHEQNITE